LIRYRTLALPARKKELMSPTEKSDAYARWLIEQANRKEKEEISLSLGRLKITLLNVVVIGLLSLTLILAIMHVPS
jgi:hypothetical protein